MIPKKLKEIRESTGMNKKEFAEYIGMKYTTYNNYETGAREPSSDFLILISSKFDVSVDYILGTQEEKKILHSYELKSSEYEHIKKYRDLDEHGKEMVDFVLKSETDRIEKYGKLEEKTTVTTPFPKRLISYYYKNASAGTGQLIIDNLSEKDIEIPDIPEYKCISYAIGVNGDSMEPIYHDGDILLVEATKEIHIGEIGIFQIDGQCFVKKLGQTELISLNDNYPNVPLDETAQTQGRIIDKLM